MKGIWQGCFNILCLLTSQAGLADVAFKIEMQNYTDAALTFYCKSITGHQQWLFPRGRITVPPRTSVTENVEITRKLQGNHEEIQCNYTGKGHPNVRSVLDNDSLPLRVADKTTDSIKIDASFKGLLRLVVNPAVSQKLQTERILDTHAEFLVSFEDR